MPLTPISENSLRQLARMDDAELRIVAGDNGNTKVGHVEGSWGKRAVRNLSILTRKAPDKGDQYTATKEAVLKSLTDLYGDPLGKKVFRANIGHMENGEHLSSRYHPITGRHIRKMIEQADREILERFASPEAGGVKLGGETAREHAPQATQDWMAGNFADFPNVQVDLRASKVEIADRPERSAFGELADALLDDANRRMLQEPNEQHFLWTLDVGIIDGAGGLGVRHPIGLAIDRDEPDKVKIFDGNVRSVTVPRSQLAAWLAAHVRTQYAGDGLELHRAQASIASYLPRSNGEWTRESEPLTIDSGRISDRLKVNMALLEKTPKPLPGHQDLQGLTGSSAFEADVRRDTFQIKMPDRDVVLTWENAAQVLTSLLQGGTDQEMSHAVYNLSLLFNQNITNSAGDLVFSHLKAEMEQGGKERCGAIQDGGSASRDIVVSRDNDKDSIHIEVEMTQPYQMAYLPDATMLDKQSSWMKVKYSLDVPLASLRTPEGYKQFVASDLQAQSKLTLLEGGQDSRAKLAMFRRDEGFVSDRVVALEKMEEALHDSAWIVQGPKMVDDALLPQQLTGDGLFHVSQLLAPQVEARVHRELFKEIAGQDPDLQQQQGGRTLFWSAITADGIPVVDIQFRHVLPENSLSNAIMFYGDDQPPDGGRFETVVSIRVPVAELNRGIPEKFDFFQPPRLEWLPVGNDR